MRKGNEYVFVRMLQYLFFLLFISQQKEVLTFHRKVRWRMIFLFENRHFFSLKISVWGKSFFISSRIDKWKERDEQEFSNSKVAFTVFTLEKSSGTTWQISLPSEKSAAGKEAWWSLILQKVYWLNGWNFMTEKPLKFELQHGLNSGFVSSNLFIWLPLFSHRLLVY